MARLTAALIPLLSCLALTHVQAQEGWGGVRLAFDADPVAEDACMSRDELHRRVDQRRGSSVSAPVPGAMEGGHVQVRLSSRAPQPGFLARLELVNAQGRSLGERELVTDAGCHELDEGVVVVMVTLLGIADRRPELEPEPEPEREPEPELEEPEAPSPPRQREPWGLVGSVGGGLSYGTLPGVTGGLVAGFAGERRFYTLGTDLMGLPRARTSLGDGARAQFGALLLRVRACARMGEWNAWRLGLCAGPLAGLVTTKTSGLGVDERGQSFVVDADAGLRLRVRPTPHGWGVLADLSAVIPIRGAAFTFVEGSGETERYHQTKPGVWFAVSVIFAGAS